MIDRLNGALGYTEYVHSSTEYSKLHEGEAQRIYNEGIIHGMKNALISAMHHIETSLVKQTAQHTTTLTDL